MFKSAENKLQVFLYRFRPMISLNYSALYLMAMIQQYQLNFNLHNLYVNQYASNLFPLTLKLMAH